MSGSAVAERTESAAGGVLLTLASGQFLMTLDSSVMNVAIATVAEDVGTTVTGIQSAITLYTLVMAMLMVAGGKIGSMIGRRRAFAIGCVIYGIGSLHHRTRAEPDRADSRLVGARRHRCRPHPPGDRRSRRRKLPARGQTPRLRPGDGRRRDRRRCRPAHRRLATTYFSWRWVFVGEVVVVLGILALARRVRTPRRRPDAGSTSSVRYSRPPVSGWRCSGSCVRRTGAG